MTNRQARVQGRKEALQAAKELAANFGMQYARHGNYGPHAAAAFDIEMLIGDIDPDNLKWEKR